MTKIGQKLKQARIDSGLSRPELEKLTGIRADEIYRWETGVVMPGADKMIKICQALGIKKIDYFK